MNEAAKVVSEALLGVDFKTVRIAGKGYTVRPATIKIMARGFSHWAKIDFKEAKELSSVISQIPGCFPCILRGLSLFVTGDVRWWRIKSYLLYRKWLRGTPSAGIDEGCEAVKVVLSLISAQVFFSTVNSLKNVTNLIAKTKQNSLATKH